MSAIYKIWKRLVQKKMATRKRGHFKFVQKKQPLGRTFETNRPSSTSISLV